jgi:hypothetical protein
MFLDRRKVRSGRGGMGTSSGRCRNGPRVVSVAEVGVPLTKAVKRTTLYEATFSKKPDLSDVHAWGEKGLGADRGWK